MILVDSTTMSNWWFLRRLPRCALQLAIPQGLRATPGWTYSPRFDISTGKFISSKSAAELPVSLYL
jgi:hypothetical protein